MMNERKIIIGKNAIVSGMMVMTAMLSAMITGCGCQKADEVSLCTPDSAATADSVPAVTYSKEEQAVLDENLSIDAAGNVTDGSGKQLKVGEDGKVEVKKADGTVVKVDPDTVRNVRQQAESADQSSGGSQQATEKPVTPTQSPRETSPQKPKETVPQTKPTVKPTEPRPTSPRPAEKTQPTTVDPHAGKAYHEAEYEYIKHPAETKQVKVVDREAYSYEEPVYEEKWSMICWGCGADVGNDNMTTAQRDEHMYQHILNGEPDGYHSGYTTVQVGTRTVNVPEESHYETKIVKEAWTEKKLIREAGWY